MKPSSSIIYKSRKMAMEHEASLGMADRNLGSFIRRGHPVWLRCLVDMSIYYRKLCTLQFRVRNRHLAKVAAKNREIEWLRQPVVTGIIQSSISNTCLSYNFSHDKQRLRALVILALQDSGKLRWRGVCGSVVRAEAVPLVM